MYKQRTQNELYHHGIPGMRWGVRRSHDRYGALTKTGAKQETKIKNEFGKLSAVNTLTPRGVKRKNDLQSAYKKLTGNDIVSSEKAATKERKKTLREMTDDELRAYNNRKQLETTYLNYQPKAKVSKGKQFVNSAMTKVIAPVAVDVGKAYVTKMLKQQLGLKEPEKNKIKLKPKIK